ncbi:hypothetical protein [Pseudothermotoga thermarum]|uniref:Uncharacterized protein n=1 Tax=Pseudothermotoga thermarum DSM 5069 TaxID=688269 RepID=F7YYL0_9THEM|nr:hypothetical protein [Pseudothermotoga thermarum]AEH51042.1 hypothetical protein Theth_0959 [Pseudothermotoga thermarum DSM 5069]
MRELLIILKYGLKGSFPRKSERKLPRNVLLALAFAFVYGIPLSVIFFELFKQTFHVVIDGLDFPTIIVSYWLTMITAIFFTSLFTNLVSSFVKNEEITMLLSYPLKRSSIALYQMILTFVNQAFAAVMYFSVFIAYSIATGRNVFLATISGLLMFFFVFSLSLILASSVGLLMRKSTARTVNVVTLLLSVVIFLVSTQMLPELFSKFLEGKLESFVQIGEKLLSHLNIFIWPVYIIQGSYAHLASLFLLGMLTWFLSLKMADRLTFEENQKSVSKRTLLITNNFGLMKKELKTLLRQSQTVMMFFYPIILWLILGYTTKSVATSVIFVIFMSSLYVSVCSALLVGQELYVWPIPKTMPVEAKVLLIPKIVLPPLLFCGVFMASSILIQLFLKVSGIFYLLYPAVFVLYLFAAVMGVDVTLKHKKATEIMNPSKILSMEHILRIQVFTIAASFGLVFPITLRIERLEFLKLFLKNDLLVDLTSFGVPLVFSVFLILFCIEKIKSMSKKFCEME